MSTYLLMEDKKFRVDSENQVDLLIEEYKQKSGIDLVSYSSTKKTTKDDEYFVVKIKIQYNDEKNPV